MKRQSGRKVLRFARNLALIPALNQLRDGCSCRSRNQYPQRAVAVLPKRVFTPKSLYGGSGGEVNALGHAMICIQMATATLREVAHPQARVEREEIEPPARFFITCLPLQIFSWTTPDFQQNLEK